MAKGFQSGKAWKGNRNGAPKKEFRRDDFTNEFFADNKENIRSIGNNVISKALHGNEKAEKFVWDKFFTDPKTRDSYEIDVHAHEGGKLGGVPQEKLMRIKAILLEETHIEESR